MGTLARPRRLAKVLVLLFLAGAVLLVCSSIISAQNKASGLPVPQRQNLNKLDFYQRYSNKIYIKVPEPDCKNRRFLIYRCTSACQGFGNRQQGIISVFLLALLTGRTFILEMTSPCDVNKFLEPNMYDWNKCKQYLRQEDLYEQRYYNFLDVGNYKLPASWEHLNYEILWPEKIVSLTLRYTIVHQIRMHKNINKTMKWIHQLSNPEVEMSILGILFKPKPSLVGELTHFFHEKVNNRKLVCGHIRNYGSPTFKFDLGYYKKANTSKIFAFLKSYDDINNNVIYVASDSIEIKAEASKLFSNFVYYNATVVHIDREQERLDEMCSGFHDLIVEQLILSKCDVLVLSRGTLGFMAATMRGTTEGFYMYSLKKGEVEPVNDLSIVRNKYQIS